MASPPTVPCDTLSYAEMMAKLGVKKSTFFVWLRDGRLDHLRCPAPLAYKFSRVLVEKWLANDPAIVRRGLRAAS